MTKKGRTKAGGSKAEAAAKRDLFIKAFISNRGNATQAAISAGYSKKTAYSAGCRLLKRVEVKAAIEVERRDASEKAGLTVERTLQEVARLAYFDPGTMYDAQGNLLPVHKMDAATRAAIAGVEVNETSVEGVVIGHTKKIKHADKNSALDKAMKHLGLYKRDNEQQPPTVVVRGTRVAPFQPYRGRTAPQARA